MTSDGWTLWELHYMIILGKTSTEKRMFTCESPTTPTFFVCWCLPLMYDVWILWLCSSVMVGLSVYMRLYFKMVWLSDRLIPDSWCTSLYLCAFVFVEFYLIGWSLMVGGCWLIVVTPAAFTIACIFYANCSKVSARRSLRLNPGWAILSLGYPSPIIWFKSLIVLHYSAYLISHSSAYLISHSPIIMLISYFSALSK